MLFALPHVSTSEYNASAYQQPESSMSLMVLPQRQQQRVKRLLCLAGKATGALSQDSDALWIEQVWGDPVGGHGSECAWSPEPGTLYVDSTIQVKGKTAQYRQVYRAQT